MGGHPRLSSKLKAMLEHPQLTSKLKAMLDYMKLITTTKKIKSGKRKNDNETNTQTLNKYQLLYSNN